MTSKELREIYFINNEIKMWQRELDRLQCKSLVKSQEIDDMPRGNKTSDKTADYAIERTEVETIIEGKLAELQIQRKRTIEYIASIKDSIDRQIVFLWSVSCMGWTEIARELGEGWTKDAVKNRYYRHFKKVE